MFSHEIEGCQCGLEVSRKYLSSQMAEHRTSTPSDSCYLLGNVKDAATIGCYCSYCNIRYLLAHYTPLPGAIHLCSFVQADRISFIFESTCLERKEGMGDNRPVKAKSLVCLYEYVPLTNTPSYIGPTDHDK